MINKSRKHIGLSIHGYLMDMPTMPKQVDEEEKLETMGARIKTLRESKNMTQTELGAACGVSRSCVSQWEADKIENIKLQTFLTLLTVLSTDFQYLIFGPTRRAAPKLPGGKANGETDGNRA